MDTQNLVKTKRKFKSTQLFVVAGTILVSLLISLLCVGLTVRYEVDTETADIKSIKYWKLNLPPQQEEWFEKGIEELRTVALTKHQLGEVENVLVFIAEGVNGDMLSRARFRQNGNIEQANDFVWDKFPHVGILKRSCSHEEICDEFTVATALFGGVKTIKGLGGLDRRVSAQNCHQASNESYHISSIFKQAKALNIRTGFVTTGRVSGPLVAGLYAHSSDTHWECDGYVPESLKAKCMDIASQLFESKEGKNVNVIMGGGRQTLVSATPRSNQSLLDESACISLDQRNFLKYWMSSKLKAKVTFQLLQTSEELESLEGLTKDYVLGIFANGDLSDKDPKLINMVTKSLDVLRRNNSRYILVSEKLIKTNNLENLQQNLWELDDAIKTTLKHPGFTPHNSVLLTVFLDLKHTANVPNDVLLYATGPKTYLFHGVHEETYMAQVISYCLKMGIFRGTENLKRKTNL